MRTIGVTGGSGFIAGHTIQKLWERGYEVVTLDRREGRPNSASKRFLGDMRDKTAMFEFAAHVDGIIHLAGVLGTQETIQHPQAAVMSNIEGGINFLEAAAAYDIPGVYIGVGNHYMQNPYSISKTTVERFVHMYNQYRGTRVNIVRAVNAYGPNQSVAAPFGSSKVRKITPSFICRALSGADIELYGGGSQTSDMVYAPDVAEVLIRALEYAHDYPPLPTIEVGPETHTTVREMAEMVVRQTNSSSRLVDLPMRPGETPDAVVIADTATLSVIGLKASDLTSLEEGLKHTIEYFRETQGVTWNAVAQV